MLLDLQADIIYGPVRYRRLGRSLGINILPAERKVCSFDCLYCQYGFSQGKTMEEAGKERHGLLSVEDPRTTIARWTSGPLAARGCDGISRERSGSQLSCGTRCTLEATDCSELRG